MAQQSVGQIKKYLKQLKQRQEQYLYYLGRLAFQAGEDGKLGDPQMEEAYRVLKDIQDQIFQWEASLEQLKAAKAQAKQPKCPYCGSAVVKGAVYCASCGQPVATPAAVSQAAAYPAPAPAQAVAPPAPETPRAPAGKRCPNCGEALDEDAVFCGNCGAKVAGPLPPPETAAAPEPAPPAPAPPAGEAAVETPPAETGAGEEQRQPAQEPEAAETPPEAEVQEPAGEEAGAGGEAPGRICPGCGAHISDESAVFCPECGTKVRK